MGTNLPEGQPSYTIAEGKACVWYPDGDLMAVVHGNLGGIEPIDDETVMGVIKRSKKAEAATSQEPPKPTGLQLSVPEKVRRGISLSPKEYAEFVQQTRCKAPVDEDEDDGPDNQPDEVVE